MYNYGVMAWLKLQNSPSSYFQYLVCGSVYFKNLLNIVIYLPLFVLIVTDGGLILMILAMTSVVVEFLCFIYHVTTKVQLVTCSTSENIHIVTSRQNSLGPPPIKVLRKRWADCASRQSLYGSLTT